MYNKKKSNFGTFLLVHLSCPSMFRTNSAFEFCKKKCISHECMHLYHLCTVCMPTFMTIAFIIHPMDTSTCPRVEVGTPYWYTRHIALIYRQTQCVLTARETWWVVVDIHQSNRYGGGARQATHLAHHVLGLNDQDVLVPSLPVHVGQGCPHDSCKETEINVDKKMNHVLIWTLHTIIIFANISCIDMHDSKGISYPSMLN